MRRAVDQTTAGAVDIAEAIRAMQRSGEALPSERRLAGMFGVKRHQLRKVLGAMREAGELTPPRRSRTRVARKADLAALANPVEVIELRMVWEPALARLAALRASGGEVSDILQLASTPPDADAGAVDRAFHTAIARAARNNLGAAFYEMLRQVGRDARIRGNGIVPGAFSPERIARRDGEHARIAEAIAARDPDAAEAAMRQHLAAVQTLVEERSRLNRIDAA